MGAKQPFCGPENTPSTTQTSVNATQVASSISDVDVLGERAAGGSEAVRPVWTRAAGAVAVLGDARAPLRPLPRRPHPVAAAQPPRGGPFHALVGGKMRQEHRCAPSRQRTRPRRPAVASALCPGCPWPWQCARGHTKTWDAAPAPLSPAMPLPLWCAGEVVQRALTRAPRPGRQTAFARRSHHRHRCVGACGSGAGGVVGRAPRLRARSGETRFLVISDFSGN